MYKYCYSNEGAIYAKGLCNTNYYYMASSMSGQDESNPVS